MPKIPSAGISKCLESVTGADVLITLKKFPANTPAQVRRHVESGSILIQFKFGSDLISSITDERVNIALARMIECGARHQYQRVILGVGLYLPDLKTGKTLVGRVMRQSAGKVSIRWRASEPEIDYRALATVRRRIGLRGGIFLNLTCDEEVIGELHAMESDLKFLSSYDKKELLHLSQFPPDPPDPTDPLQIPIEVKDARKIIAAHRGIGPKKTNELWNVLREHNESVCEGTDVDPEPTLMQALSWILETDRTWARPKKISGWGPGTLRNIKEQWGLLSHQDIAVRNGEVADE